MALDASTVALIQQWVGTVGFDVTDIETRYLRLGSVEATALEVLRARYADFLLSPASLTVAGDYSRDHSANLKALAGRIAELEGIVGSGASVITTGLLVRPDRVR